MNVGIRWLCKISLFCLIMVDSGAALAVGGVMCPNPETDKPEPVSVLNLQSEMEDLRARVERGPFHVLDLGSVIQARRRRISEDLELRKWCIVRSHLVNIDDELGGLALDSDFVMEKFRRVERWARSGERGDVSGGMVGLYLRKAAKSMSKRKVRVANGHLNDALTSLFGGTKWTLPSEERLTPLQNLDSAGEFVEIASYDVEMGCPDLNKMGKRELKGVVKRLVASLETRKLRPLDLPDGISLLDDFRGYTELEATGPAIRVACVLKSRLEEVEIGLPSVMRRFRTIGRFMNERQMNDDDRQRFLLLVRAAATDLGKREFGRAHRKLEQALILLGEPISLVRYFTET